MLIRSVLIHAFARDQFDYRLKRGFQHCTESVGEGVNLARLRPDYYDVRNIAPGERDRHRRQQMIDAKLVQTVRLIWHVNLVQR